MTTALSEYSENRVINSTLRATNLTAPASVWVAFFTTWTGLETGTITAELSGNGYARQQLTFGAPVSGSSSNTNTVSWTATADWATITAIAIMDASASGNVLYSKAVGSKRLRSGQTMYINPGNITVIVD